MSENIGKTVWITKDTEVKVIPDPKFKKGDVIVLKSGSPKLTVCSFIWDEDEEDYMLNVCIYDERASLDSSSESPFKFKSIWESLVEKA